ncbi:MAG TPA: hypothetical protein VMZ71_03950 [Gemmataceae bacterium]|nr:hypothetical protein [Gemmataceae bacterium]
MSPARSTQKLGIPLPSRYTSTLSTNGSSRFIVMSRRRPHTRISRAAFPLNTSPVVVNTVSHGSATIRGCWAGTNSNRRPRRLPLRSPFMRRCRSTL